MSEELVLPLPKAKVSQISLEFAVESTEEPSQKIKPFLRWAGGKTRLLGAILPFVPSKIIDYHEPFLGSGAMFFAVRSRARQCFVSDLNTELVNLWQVLRKEPKAFYERIQPFLQRQGEDMYYEVRAESPEHYLDRAARFFYLNPVMSQR